MYARPDARVNGGRAEMSESVPSATPAELEILTVLWPLGEGQALRLGEIHERVGTRRKDGGQAVPAVTTVSSTLRGALAKGLLVEVRKVGDTVSSAPKAGGKSLVTSRSPQTAYRAAYTPGQVLGPLLGLYAGLYPPADPLAPVLDLLRELGYPAKTVGQVEALLRGAAAGAPGASKAGKSRP